ncbi:hypothetical protein JCM10213_000347 [Rhodosporidiobolus nylandii]
MPPTSLLPLSTYPTICLVKLVALAPARTTNTLPHQHLDHLLALALECVLEDNAPASLNAWLARVSDDERSEGLEEVREEIRETVLEVRERGSDAASLWALSEMKPLVAVADEEEVSLSPHPLARNSPLGLYLRRTQLRISKLDFGDACCWWADFEAWCEGRPVAKRRRTEDAGEKFAQARARTDYNASRELVRSFSTTNDSGVSDTSPQQALLHLALVEYEDGGFEAAQSALDEATQIARTLGDIACLSACSSLRQRLALARSSSAATAGGSPSSSSASSAPLALPSGDLSTNSNAPYDLLSSLSSLSRSVPVPSLFSPLYRSAALAQHFAFPSLPASSSSSPQHQQQQKKDQDVRPLPGEVDEDWAAGWEAAVGAVWGEMGITPLASLHEALALEFLDPARPSWDVTLPISSRQASRLLRANRKHEALRLLLEAVDTPEKRRRMGLSELERWRGIVEGVVDGSLAGGAEAQSTDEDLPLPALLSRSLTSLQLSTKSLHEPQRLLALLSVIDQRLSLAGGVEEAKRGLQEIEGEWGAVLALAGAGAEGGEGRVVQARALEVRARCAVVKATAEGDDAQLPAAVELLEQALAGYTHLSSHPSALRTLSTLTHLCSHLSTSPTLPPSSAAHWRAKRDEYAGRWLALQAEGGREDEKSGEVRRRVGEVVREVGRAVELSVGIGR